MPKNLDLTENLEKYIINNSEDLHPAQKELIEKNNKLGEVKRMQISISQAHFFQILIKTAKIKTILEIGTFDGNNIKFLSTLFPEASIVSVDLEDDNKLLADEFDVELSFSEAFSLAREITGPGCTFAWNDNLYTTDRADDYQIDGSNSDKYALDTAFNQSTAAVSITIAP